MKAKDLEKMGYIFEDICEGVMYNIYNCNGVKVAYLLVNSVACIVEKGEIFNYKREVIESLKVQGKAFFA